MSGASYFETIGEGGLDVRPVRVSQQFCVRALVQGVRQLLLHFLVEGSGHVRAHREARLLLHLPTSATSTAPSDGVISSACT